MYVEIIASQHMSIEVSVWTCEFESLTPLQSRFCHIIVVISICDSFHILYMFCFTHHCCCCFAYLSLLGKISWPNLTLATPGSCLRFFYHNDKECNPELWVCLKLYCKHNKEIGHKHSGLVSLVGCVRLGCTAHTTFPICGYLIYGLILLTCRSKLFWL
jgi:hypothetical protein